MPTPTYIPLATVTLASADAEILLSSIPAGYRDLRLVFFMPSAAIQPQFRPNSSTTDLTRVNMYGWSGGTTSNTSTFWGSINDADLQRLMTLDFMDYAQTDKHKTVLIRGSEGASITSAMAGRWGQTTAISSIQIVPNTSSFPIGTQVSLYGVN